MRRLTTWIVAGVLATASPLLAMDRPVVVELFTSQGCSSCPPADALLEDLATRDDVIALALHVDYWDYIGWEDGFAEPEYTTRQKHYAIAMSEKMIYTPQIIIDGEVAVVGNDTSAVRLSIEQAQGKDDLVDLHLSETNDMLTVQAKGLTSLPSQIDVFLVRFVPRETVEISRGENAGKTIVYANVVREWRKLGTWTGRGSIDLTAGIPGDMETVVLLQKRGNGAILAAAKLQ